jgi:chaperonin GroEL
MGKRIFYDDDARSRVLAGAELLYKAVATTMGPKGRNVVIGKNYGPGVVTHDGVTVAKSIELPETEETLGFKVGADMIKGAASKMNDIAGDGTTTVTVLAYHLLNEANKLIAAGYNPMELRKGLEQASEKVIAKLKELSEEITEKSPKVAQIATISAGDAEIGKLIADVIKKVGKDGVVTVEEGQGLQLESEVVKGFTFPKGFVSPYMVTDQARMEAVIDKPFVLVTDVRIASINDLLPVIDQIAKIGRKDLVIIADDVEGDALQALVLNKLKDMFRSVAIKAPSFGDNRKEVLNDIAILTGGTLISEDQGYSLQTATLDMLGQAQKVIVTQDETTIIEGIGAAEDIDNRIAQIRSQKENSTDNYAKERYEERAAALGGKVAVIKVGGVTESEIEEKKFRVDDAVHAVKAALAEGIVAGGGVTLLHLSTITDDILLSPALEKPFRILMDNSGLSAERWLPELHKQKSDLDLGIDVTRPDQGLLNLKKIGVIDPTKVTKEAIQNAVSLAGVTMTMGALVVEEPASDTAPQMPQMPMRP